MTHSKIKQVSAIIFLILISTVCIALLLLALGKEENTLSFDNVYRALGLNKSAPLSDDFLQVIDVDQGDSILISSNGKNLLLDTGPANSASLLCTHLVSNKIEKIDALMLTHFHDDHTGGVEKLMNKFPIDTLILPQFAKIEEDTENVRILRSKVLENGGKVFTAAQGMSVDIGDFELTTLAYYGNLETENARCIITMARFEDKKFLLMSDATKGAEELLLKEGLNLDCDVIKLGHHGSSTSTSKELLCAATPDYAVISCGLGNIYLHPHAETLSLIDDMEIELYRTDFNGTVSFYMTEDGISVSTEEKY